MSQVDTLLSRQSQIIPVEGIAGKSVGIIGSGNIGSNVAHVIASMGVRNLYLIDGDEAAEENLFPGFFSHADLGESKTVAVRRGIEKVLGAHKWMSIDGHAERVTAFPTEFDIGIVATDDLETRMDIWHNSKEQGVLPMWYIDGRMGGNLANVICFSPHMEPDRIEWYEEMFLNPDKLDGSETLPCGLKATAPLTKGFIPGFVAKAIRDIAHDVLPYYVQSYNLGTGLHIQATN